LYRDFPLGKIGVQRLYRLFPDDFFRELPLYGTFLVGKNSVQRLYCKITVGENGVQRLYADFPEAEIPVLGVVRTFSR
jgi:hypothetical protein